MPEIHRTVFRLEFEGSSFDGWEVYCRNAPLGVFFRLARLKDMAEAVGAEQLFDDFAEHALISWNLTDAGKDIPPTREGLALLEPADAMAIILAWMQGAAGVSGPLGSPSSDGNGLRVVMTPTATEY